jgi:hypothetical protein
MKKWVKISLIVLGSLIIVGGLWIISNIFSAPRPGIPVNQNIVEKLREDINDNKQIGIFPSERKVILKQGSNKGGFAFAIKNDHLENSRFIYKVNIADTANIKEDCNLETKEEAESWILDSQGTMILAKKSDNTDYFTVVLFEIPEDAPLCTIPYVLNVTNLNSNQSFADTVYVTITED